MTEAAVWWGEYRGTAERLHLKSGTCLWRFLPEAMPSVSRDPAAVPPELHQALLISTKCVLQTLVCAFYFLLFRFPAGWRHLPPATSRRAKPILPSLRPASSSRWPEMEFSWKRGTVCPFYPPTAACGAESGMVSSGLFGRQHSLR